MAHDFEYSTDENGWYSLFPMNDRAVEIYNEICKSEIGPGKLPPHWFASIKSDLRSAGYSMRKAPKPKMTKASMDRLMRDLDL